MIAACAQRAEDREVLREHAAMVRKGGGRHILPMNAVASSVPGRRAMKI
jgi:hypothetical protein